jgi:protease I
MEYIMNHSLKGKMVAILVADGFEQDELTKPQQALQEAGAQTRIISPAHGIVKAWNHTDWGDEFHVDVPLDKADPNEYNALLLPGGVMNPDKLRRDQKVLSFVRKFFLTNKPVAAICHGPWTLIDAGVVKGRKMTSYPSLQTDLENAGALWMNREVVVDNGLVTSRNVQDIPAFNQKMIEEFAEGRHNQTAAQADRA